MRSTVIFGAILLAACGAHHGSAAPAPTAAVVPCAVFVPNADSLDWKLVAATGFTFCVPARWRPAGARGWRGDGASIEWAVGSPPQTSEAVVRVPSSVVDQAPMPRHFVEIIGGESAELSDTHLPGADFTAAHWSEKRLYFQGKAGSPRTVDIELTIYRTVRFDAAHLGS